jgi:hypothetical protein
MKGECYNQRAMMDNDYGIDVQEVMRVIRTADVLMLRFVVVPQRLLLDSRSNDLDGPLLKIVPRVSGARERFRELRRLRPRFPLPDRITAVHWPHRVSSLASTGVWDVVRERLTASGVEGTESQADQIFEELRKLEYAEVQKAIKGDGYHTYWERPC